ncbi:hypothetical protein GT348_08915 (plasmid) [Aristophania vespae]|uniref:Uncharacterized protein n=2 Tax=Aristophania vespae TaxID=2697033 RepID=A0A6P1NI12_9PROT|nr:hypothetical protein GT348_08915 [Aristophania vespae]UMM64791.1 hypothetical protein DM15PD_18110 [Aristophania vespae]
MVSACSPDYLARKITGRECSAGYIAKGDDWCMPIERNPPPQPYCTQSWNGVDCFARPDLIPNVAHEVYEGPRGLTQDQNARRLNMPIEGIPPTSQFLPP